MRTFFLTLAMSLTSIFAFGQSYDKLWKQVDQYEEGGKPQSAYKTAKKILKKAQQDAEEAWISAEDGE